MENNKAEIKRLDEMVKQNREKINQLLHKDMPLDLLRMRINMLSAQNADWIERINVLKQKSEK